MKPLNVSIKDVVMGALLLLSAIGMIDMASHSMGGPCVNPLNIAVRQHCPNGLLFCTD